MKPDNTKYSFSYASLVSFGVLFISCCLFHYINAYSYKLPGEINEAVGLWWIIVVMPGSFIIGFLSGFYYSWFDQRSSITSKLLAYLGTVVLFFLVGSISATALVHVFSEIKDALMY